MATNFHGFAWALLRRYWRSLLLPVNVGELSMVDDNHAIDELVSRGGKLFWDEKKCFQQLPPLHENGQDEDLRHGIRPFNRIIKDRFASNGLLPYSGMISLAIELLADFPKLRSYCRRRTLSLLVDEAQDTNALCYIFLNGLLSDESGICMFGDPFSVSMVLLARWKA
ncbi:MAG: UvrD-helicase domain-containing protein [Collinsella sp.]